MPADDQPIRRVRSDGNVDVLGVWRAGSNMLELDRVGFPLRGPGSHHVEGDLPWVFHELAPDGFLASRFAQWFAKLGLPTDRRLWRSDQVVSAVSECGHDLPGNLLIGDGTFERYRRIFAPGMRPGPVRGDRQLYSKFVDDILRDAEQSSVGGARPKFALRLADQSGVIVKFTPPLDTPTGQRWADLLRMEAHAAATLREAGIAAVHATYVELGERGFLEIDRFDRLAGGGRVGHVTLHGLGAALYAEVASAPRVVESLVRDGHLGVEDARVFARIHAFSRSIANTDTHQGNYGLIFDDDGRARLAPAYDVVPMAFAPRHDELPDLLIPHAPAADASTRALVLRLIARVEADADISAEFRRAWLTAVG